VINKGLLLLLLFLCAALQLFAQLHENSINLERYVTYGPILVPYRSFEEGLTSDPKESSRVASLKWVEATSLGNDNFISKQQIFTGEAIVPDSWVKEKVFLYIDAPKAPFTLEVNGAKLQVNKVGVNTSIYLSPLLKEGTKTVFLKITPLGGKQTITDIAQDFLLVAKPALSINSVYITSHPVHKGHYRTLTWAAGFNQQNLSNIPLQTEYIRHEAYVSTSVPFVSALADSLKPGGTTIQPEARNIWSVHHIKEMYTHFWTAETPNLLQVGHLQTSSRYRIQEVVSQDVGVRVVEEKQGRMHVNGVPVQLYPVAFQHPPLDEKTASKKELENFIVKLKQHNVNTLVVSGLPVNEDLYELADMYGLYVIQKVETNSGSAADPQLWLLQQASMVYRIRNHPSLIAWQLGNSTQKTEKEMLQAFADSLGNTSSYNSLNLDPYRPVLFASPLGMPVPVKGFDTLSEENKKQLKKKYQPLHLFLQDTIAGKISLRNLQQFASLTKLQLDWEIWDSTTSITQGSIQDIQLLPQKTKVIQLPIEGKEYNQPGRSLRIRIRLGKDTAWARQGHELAWENFCF
jgi:hypothetical protein